MASTRTPAPVGQLLREWRERRRLSQLELSIQANISTRHLSFVETGRSKPTPEMILLLTEHMEVPLRERNQLLLAGGYAPAYPQHGLDEPELESVRQALAQVLTAHAPFPAIVINRWWELVDSNEAMQRLVAGCAPALLQPPVNVLRLSLHPSGLAPRIINLGQWRAHLLEQLHRRSLQTGDAKLLALETELRAYPGGDPAPARRPTAVDVVLPLRLRAVSADATGATVDAPPELSFFSIVAAAGTATDVTVDELQIESFFPANQATARALRTAAR